jgi:hypothetical protein
VIVGNKRRPTVGDILDRYLSGFLDRYLSDFTAGTSSFVLGFGAAVCVARDLWWSAAWCLAVAVWSVVSAARMRSACRWRGEGGDRA